MSDQEKQEFSSLKTQALYQDARIKQLEAELALAIKALVAINDMFEGKV